jgi:iron complex outermembrane receptor protein
MGMTKYTILCLAAVVAAVVAPAAADQHAPSSLRMRLQPDDEPAGGAPAPPPPASDPPASDPPAAEPPAAEPPAAEPPAAEPPAAPESPAPAANPAVKAIDDDKTEVIDVTDSPIEHELLTGRAPISLVTRADLTASGRATLGGILQSMTVQSNAGNAQVNAGGDGSTRINLRGLGVSRTLVVLNGRRIVNGGLGADATVDLDAIPLAAIERVEVLKDGASALYGADAVGGVVNLVTRPKFDGLDVTLLTSTSQRGDGTEYDASFVTGFTTRNERTYLVVAVGGQRHDAVFAGDRGFSTFQRSYDFANKSEVRYASTAAPSGRLDVSSIGIDGVPSGIHLPGCASDVCKPDGSGGWVDFTAPRDLYNDTAGNYLYTPSSRYGLLATAGNRLTDTTALVLEVLYLQRTSERQLAPVPFIANSAISKDSIYNPFGADILDFRRRILELGPREYNDEVTTARVVVGITGSVPESARLLKNWNYELSYNYGLTNTRGTTSGQLLDLHLGHALGPSMLDGNGVPICVERPGDATSKIVYVVEVTRPCVPLDLMSSDAIPSEQLANLTYNDAIIGRNIMSTVLATASGQVAELPNRGEISLSLGGDWRREFGERLAEVASVGYSTDNAVRPTNGRFHVFNAFGELAIVPITGDDIAQRVQVDLGARVLHHNRFGASMTYKAGGLFRTVQGISVRGTYATAFRAPSLPDIFGGVGEHNPTAEDPCDTKPPSVGEGQRTLDPMVQAACTAQGVPVGSKFTTGQQVAVAGGNRSLEPETAATATIGVVVEPPRLKGLTLTADYWRIAIDNAIELLGATTILANCYDRGEQAFCSQIHRDRNTHRITAIDQFLQNVSRTTMSGLDVALWYDTKLADLGRIHAGLEAQYLMRYDLQTSLQEIHGVGFYDLGVYPRYKARLSGNWAHPSGASGGLSLRYIGNYKECAGNNCNSERNLAEASRDVDRYFKLDLFGGYDFRSGVGRTSLQLGVNNVFDATPPAVYNAAAANSDASTYDFVGRTVYLRLSQLF